MKRRERKITDKMRLDWLQKTRWDYDNKIGCNEMYLLSHVGHTLRRAVDWEIRKQRGGSCDKQDWF